MQGSKKYSHYFAGLLGLAMLTTFCARETVEQKPMDAAHNLSVLQDRVVRLDTLVFLNPVRTNGQVRFDLAGTPPQIQAGDLIYYPGNEGLYGRVNSSAVTGSRILMQITEIPVSQVFKTVSMVDNTSRYLLRSMNRVETDHWNLDTLDLTGWALYDGPWQTKSLVARFKSGKIYTGGSILQFSLAGQGENPWFDRMAMTCSSKMEIGADLEITTGGALDATDSVRIQRKTYGPFLLNGFPVNYQVDTWLGFHVVTNTDTVLTLRYTGNSNGNFSLTYNYWGEWKFTRSNNPQSGAVQLFTGPKYKNYIEEAFVNQIVTPIFCGESAFHVSSRYSALVGWDVTIPNWQSTQSVKITGVLRRTGPVFGTDVPASMSVPDAALYSETQSGVLENQRPRASFQVDPPAGFTDTNFEFDASASSDVETAGANLLVRWDFDGDNHFDTEFTSAKTAFHRFPLPGNYQPVLEVKDEAGLVGRAVGSIEVTLSSSAPVAYFVVTPESGRISDIFIFDANSSYDAEDPTSVLKVRWDFDGDGTWDTSWSIQKTAYYVFRTEGKYVAKLEVLDTQGLTGSTTRIITVAKANIKPTAFFTVNPENGTTETRFAFDASGSTDPEDSTSNLQVRWDWDNDGTYDTDYRTLKTIQHVFPVAGIYTVVLEVIDTQGYGATFTREVTVTNPNTAPNADFSITPLSGHVGEVITFDASLSTDQEDPVDLLQVRWDWNNDNIFDTEFTTDKVIRKTFTEPGTYIITLQVKDSGGLMDTRVKLVIIQ